MKTKSHPGRFLSAVLLVMAFVVTEAVADSVDVSPNSGVGNTPITVTATGFDETGNMAVFFYLDTPSSFEQPGYWGVCFGSGSCQLQASMPATPGSHTVYAYGYQNAFAQTQFTVLTPVFILDHSCLTNGTPLIMTGDNFAQGANINLYLDGGSFLGQGHTDSSGRFAKEITLGLPNGSHTITAYNGDGEIAGVQTFVVGSNDCPMVGQAGNLTCGSTGCPTITHPGQQPQKLNPNDPIYFGDVITTGAGGRVDLLFIDDTQLTIGENAELTVDEYVYDPNTGAGAAHYSFLRGVFVYTSGLIGHEDPDDNIKIHTAYGSTGVRGTQFITRLDPCSTTEEVDLIKGELAITPQNTGVTNIVDAPVTILFDASTVTTSALAQATFDAMVAQIDQTNPVTFASWQVQYFGCTNNNPSAAADADPYGKGISNTNQFLLGLNPTNPASVFRILSVVPQTNKDMVITWATGAGPTNTVQAAGANGNAGSLTNFTDISGSLVMPGSGDATNSYIDASGATNIPSRYYRIRLGL